MSFLEALILDQVFEIELLLVYIHISGTKKLALLSTVLQHIPSMWNGNFELILFFIYKIYHLMSLKSG